MVRLHLALAAVAAGCASTPVDGSCRVDGDCQAGQACVAGECRAVAGAADLGAPPAVGDLSRPASQPLDLTPPAALDGASPVCSFNHNGVIDRDELPVLVGLGGLYAINGAGQPVTVSLQQQGGQWDYSAPATGDRKHFDQLQSPVGTWWSGEFPDATYAEELDADSGLLGVYKATATSIQLLGVVSASAGLTQTDLKYATPIDVLRFPLQAGASWTSASTVSGQASGVLFGAYEEYVFTVDERGQVKVPAGTFDSLRVRMSYTQTIGALVTTQYTDLFLTECYGLVARLRSQDDEPNVDFTTASEYRRLATL
jgi:hypothetical protein